MVMLMGKPRRGFLPAREAFEEAVGDIRMHEVAVLAAMQEAWFSLLQRFDPKELSQRLEDDSGLAHLLGSKKARCWDAFTTLYDSIAGNAADEWERTFQNVSCLRILLSRAGVYTKQEQLMPMREMGDGSEQGSTPEGTQRGRVRSSIRERGAVPCGGGQVAVARRLRLPGVWRPTA